MSRFAIVVAIVAMLLAPALATAQAPEPVGIVSEDETTVTRVYDNPAAITDAIIGLFSFGFTSDLESEASGLLRSMPSIFAAGMASEAETAGVTVGDPVEIPVAAIGDESRGLSVTFTMFGSVDGEIIILAVRKATWVQVMMGMGIGTVATQAELEAMAQALLPRWPSTDPITVRPDGLRAGGIWNMMPLPEDMPAGFQLDETLEEGPGPGDAAVTVPSIPGSETPTPGIDIPLLPTPTPDGGGAVPGAETPVVIPPIGQTPAAPTPTTVATPAPNPRLALPFDVTIEIFLPMDMATVAEDGSCAGTGLLDGLATGGSLTLQAAQGTEGSATAPLSGPGVIAYDTETQREICYFFASFVDVPARASYTLVAGESVLGRYGYDELNTGEPVLIELGGSE